MLKKVNIDSFISDYISAKASLGKNHVYLKLNWRGISWSNVYSYKINILQVLNPIQEIVEYKISLKG